MIGGTDCGSPTRPMTIPMKKSMWPTSWRTVHGGLSGFGGCSLVGRLQSASERLSTFFSRAPRFSVRTSMISSYERAHVPVLMLHLPVFAACVLAIFDVVSIH